MSVWRGLASRLSASRPSNGEERWTVPPTGEHAAGPRFAGIGHCTAQFAAAATAHEVPVSSPALYPLSYEAGRLQAPE
jgi:hypothetical protein